MPDRLRRLRILLTKTDVAGDGEKLRERLARINAALVYTVVRGDIRPVGCFNTGGMLERAMARQKPTVSTLLR